MQAALYILTIMLTAERRSYSDSQKAIFRLFY